MLQVEKRNMKRNRENMVRIGSEIEREILLFIFFLNTLMSVLMTEFIQVL